VILDWLSVSFSSAIVMSYGDFEASAPAVPFLDVLGLYDSDSLEVRESGGFNYLYSAVLFPGVLWYWGGSNGNFHLRVSGGGLAFLRNRGWSLENFKRVVMLGKITRMDIAIDDKSGLLDLEEIKDFWHNENVSTRFRGMDVVQSWGVGRQYRGQTLYFGKREAQRFIRIYDKAAQVGSNDHWIRVELEMKGSQACQIFSDWARSGFEPAFIKGVFLQTLNFTVGNDSNRSRRNTVDWWLAFLDNAVRVKVIVGSDPDTVGRVRDWIVKQCSSSLWLLSAAFGSSEVAEIIGEASPSTRQVALLKAFLMGCEDDS